MLFTIVLALTIGCIAFILAREGQWGPRPDGLRGRIQARGWGLLLRRDAPDAAWSGRWPPGGLTAVAAGSPPPTGSS